MRASEFRTTGALLRHWSSRLDLGERVLRQLLAHRLGTVEALLLAHPDRSLPEDLDERLALDLEHLEQGRPLAWLYGSQPFMDWSFRCDARALIPRPETEALVARVAERRRARPPHAILDLCCGSGVMGLTLALCFPAARADLTDLSPEALALCEENIALHHLDQRASCHQGDLWDALPDGARYDLIVANPPYVAHSDTVDPQVLAHEPHLALFSEDSGMAHIKRILDRLHEFLEPEGTAAFELGHYHEQALGPYLAQRSDSARFHFDQDPFGVSRYLFYS